NLRLQDGHKAKSILPWLNSLPEVQEVLKSEFSGEPVNPVNLTLWRQGGFRNWLAHQQASLLFENFHSEESHPVPSVGVPAPNENLQQSSPGAPKPSIGPITTQLAHWVALQL